MILWVEFGRAYWPIVSLCRTVPKSHILGHDEESLTAWVKVCSIHDASVSLVPT